MIPDSCYFHLPDRTEPDEILTCLAGLGRLQKEPPKSLQRTYYDTFDWRLHAAGGLLIEESENGQLRTCWRRNLDLRMLGQLMAAAPRHADELPPGPLRDSLAGMIVMRALLPVARLQLRIHRVALLDKAGKTVLRLVIEEGQAVGVKDLAGAPLPIWLCLEPIKGYGKPFESAYNLLHEQFRLEVAGPQLDELLALVGRMPQDYSSKLEIELQADMPVGESLFRILRHLLGTMQHNLEGTRQDLDSEFLHDFRVAVRRTRSLLSQVRGVLPVEASRRFRGEFRWLGQITGATRDLDVYLLKLPGYRQSLPASMQADLQPLHDCLVRQQKKAQSKLAKQLDSVRCHTLLNDWHDFLETPPQTLPWPEKAARPVQEIANCKLWKTYRRVIKEGLSIDERSPSSALHELRISCKKLRYLLEFFQRLYSQEVIRRQVKLLKALQDSLGDFHDLEVQADELRKFGHAMQAEKADLPGETFMAMGVLIDSLHHRQVVERRNFADRFARFARSENRKICRDLFKTAAKS